MNARSMVMATLAALALCTGAAAQDPVGRAEGSAANGRFLAVISDHHMGIGRTAPGTWAPTEDFRWPAAWKGFLDHLSARGRNAVDLVIAGDLFELWQPPAHIKCEGASADLGCTVEEAAAIARIVAREHARELELLADFAARGDNRVHLIPGNHDAALLKEPVWREFAAPLRTAGGRIALVRSGVWASADGYVVVEHGHQIGADVNRYAQWPQITRAGSDGAEYIERPWGERFVQRVFNEQEAAYPIVDNLSPEAAGVRFRMADRGVWGSAADVARFVAFNLFETSTGQKTALLGAPTNEAEENKWRIPHARQSGHALFAAALDANDPFRQQLMADDAQAAALRKELDALAQTLPEAEIRLLCDLAAANEKDGWKRCRPAELGSMVQATVVPLATVLRAHVRARMEEHKDMRVFLYGHTHHMQLPWRLAVGSSLQVTVANSGAFQRLIDEKGFLARIQARGWSPAEGLRRMTPEDLAPCYCVILVPYAANRPVPEALMWVMEESAREGQLLKPGADICR